MKEGRLQIFASHYAGEAPAQELVLSGADVDANKDERTLTIHGGREHVKYYCRLVNLCLKVSHFIKT